jgi:hypothetical protein
MTRQWGEQQVLMVVAKLACLKSTWLLDLGMLLKMTSEVATTMLMRKSLEDVEI